MDTASTARTAPIAMRPVVIEPVPFGTSVVHVVRDDLLQGGTAERGLSPHLHEEADRGVRAFVYASPFGGFAQVALAAACQREGFACRLFCEADPRETRSLTPHPLTVRAMALGADVSLHRTLRDAEFEASGFERRKKRSKKLPLGFDTPGFRHHLGRAIERAWREIDVQCGAPKHLWLPFGSGTTLSVFRAVVPSDVTLHAVNVRVLGDGDARVVSAKDDPRVVLHRAAERSDEPASRKAPVPSNAFYDAKLWSFILREGRAGDVWWNASR